MRVMTRVVFLGLAGYGAWALCVRYGNRLQSMRAPAQDFAQRAKSTLQHAADETTTQLGEAAKDATDQAADQLRAAK
ncbi:MAG TPA: hypothetical protein VMV37_13405 [Gammaproteobacteria bacterium]|nr:hypothetical protein [Gammaproteobacteria bacterium]